MTRPTNTEKAAAMSIGQLHAELTWHEHITAEADEGGCGISTKETVWAITVEREIAKREAA